MYSSKNSKISQHTRRQIWLQYSLKIDQKKKPTQATLALQYGVSRQTISSWPVGQSKQV